MSDMGLAGIPPGTDPKGLLDAYRAMNGGALPPGMTPEQAMLIDMGLWTSAVIDNPALLQQIQALATQRLASGQDWQTAYNQVGQNYQDLTGRVASQGQDWMSDLLTRMGITSPEAIASDPNLGGYGSTVANMTQTAAQNQATDQAWFSKMMTQNDANYAAMMQQLALTPSAVPETGGGGGGGGYGRRGYGGGGGGGGDWSAPKTTDTTNLSADVNSGFFHPGYVESVLAAVPGDLESQEYANQILDAFGIEPRRVSAGIVTKDLPIVQSAIDAALAQAKQRQAYMSQLPVQAADAQHRAQILADMARSRVPQPTGGGEPIVPEGRFGNENLRGLMDPTQRADYNTEVASYFFNRLAEHFGNQAGGEPGPSQLPASNWAMEYNRNRRATNQTLAEKMRAAAIYLQQERDKERLAEAQQAATGENPFSYEGWTGYVEKPDVEAYKENEWARSILETVLGVSRDFSQNRDWQVLNMKQADSSDTKSVQTTKNPEYAVSPDNRTVAETDPMAFEPGIGYELPFGNFGQSKSLMNKNISEATQRIIANRLNALQQRAEETVGTTEAPRQGIQRPKAKTVATTQKKPKRVEPPAPVVKETKESILEKKKRAKTKPRAGISARAARVRGRAL